MLSTTVASNLDAGQEVFSQSPEGGLILYRISGRETCQTPRRPLLKAIHSGWQEVVYFHPSCGCYSCPACAENLKFRWSLAAQYGVDELLNRHVPVDFLTVTSHEKLNSAGSRAVLAKAWPVLRKRMQRVAADHEYFLVPEQHKDGRWHIHAIVTANLKKKWWKDNARECGFGYQSDVKEVQSGGGAGAYVSKYIGKTLQSSNLPKHHRRVRLSRGWPRMPKLPPPDGWEFSTLAQDTSLQWDATQYQNAGFQVVIADPRSAWDWVNPADLISGSE